MNKLIFATGNKDKLREAGQILGLELEGVDIEIDEIQSLNPLKVASKKANDYFAAVNKALFVDDVALTFAEIAPLPGTYINDFLKTIGNAGLLKMLAGKENRTATAYVTIAYTEPGMRVITFQGVVTGTIAKEERGTSGFGWDTIFIPEGSKKTYAEMTDAEKNAGSSRTRALKSLKEWLLKEKRFNLA